MNHLIQHSKFIRVTSQDKEIIIHRDSISQLSYADLSGMSNFAEITLLNGNKIFADQDFETVKQMILDSPQAWG